MDVFEKWAGLTPADFVFSLAVLKGWHPGYVLTRGADQVEIFYRRAQALGNKLGPIAITIPDGTPYKHGDAGKYFGMLPQHPYALDIQSVPWYNSEVFAEMANRDMTFVRDRFDDSDAIGSWDYYRAPLEMQRHAGACSCGCGSGMDATVALRKAIAEDKKTYFYAKHGKEGLSPNLILRLLKVFGPQDRVKFVDLTDIKKKVLGPVDPAEGPQEFGTVNKYKDGSDKIDVMKPNPYTDDGAQLMRTNYPDKEWDGLSDPYQDKVDKGY
jgi:hypothetical protein